MKEFISKHYKLLIILLAILVVILVIAILLFNSKESSNVIPRDPYELLLVNIDDLDYNLNDVYYSEFTLIDGMNSYQVEAELRFSEDNTCEYSSTWYSEIGTYTFSSTKCNYETGEGNNLKVTMNGTLQLYNNYIMDYQTEEISDYVLNGIYKYENKSHLLLNGITYEHFDYYTYSHYGVNEVLVDYTGEIYKPDGSKFWAEDGNKIDLNLYKIIDKRQNNNNASSYVNEYDISDFDTSNSIISMENYVIENINYDMFMDALTDYDDTNIIIIGTPNCVHCERLLEENQSIQMLYKLSVKYLDYSTLTSSQQEVIDDFISTFHGEIGYPYSIIIENGVLKDDLYGYGTGAWEEFLRENEIIK